MKINKDKNRTIRGGKKKKNYTKRKIRNLAMNEKNKNKKKPQH